MFKPNFTITPAILSDIAQIAETKSLVEHSRILPLNEAKLQREAIVRMAHTSTSIEGNPLQEYQVDRVLSGFSIAADEKSILEVKNYQQGLLQIEKWAKGKKTLTLNTILELHEVLMKGLLPKDKTGHFRPGPIYIVDDLGDGREKLRYSGPDAKKVPFLINELLSWYYSKETASIHPLIKAGIFHLQFVLIHPFSDGNGRMTRLLATYILYVNGWDFRKVIVPDDYYNRDRQDYYNSLSSAHDAHFPKDKDMTSWLEYFTKGFLYEAQKVKDLLGSLAFGEGEEPTYLDKDEIKLVDYLTITGRITSKDAQEVLGIPKRTVQFKLKGLVDKGLIKSKGAGPSIYYTLAR